MHINAINYLDDPAEVYLIKKFTKIQGISESIYGNDKLHFRLQSGKESAKPYTFFGLQILLLTFFIIMTLTVSPLPEWTQTFFERKQLRNQKKNLEKTKRVNFLIEWAIDDKGNVNPFVEQYLPIFNKKYE